MQETLGKAPLKFSLVAKYLDRANLVSRLANATACFMGLIPFVTQWIIDPARILEDMGSIPGLDQWVKDLVLL